MPLARISLTLSCHFSLYFTTSARSSGLHPVSSHSCCMYVRAGRTAFSRPYVGVHRSTSLMSLFLLLQQYPACLVRLTWIVFVMGEWYTIKFCFKLEKKPQKCMEFFRLLLEHLAWIEHQFLSGIRDSRKAESLWGMMRGVGGVRKSIHQSWLAKRLGLGLVYWGFKEVQEEIPWEEASTLQIGSVAFLPGQSTSPQLHPCHRLFEQDGIQDISLPSP